MAGVNFSSAVGTSQFVYPAKQEKKVEKSETFGTNSGELLANNFTPSFAALGSTEASYHFASSNVKQTKSKTESKQKPKRKHKKPTQKLPPAVSGKKLKPLTIFLDAGHGGKDIGTSQSFTKEVTVGKGKKAKTKKIKYTVSEKNLDFQVAQQLAKILKKRGGYKVIMRRAGKSYDSFMKPAQIARTANQKRADMFLSIHTNSAKNTEAKGFEVHMAENHFTGKKKQTTSNLVGRGFAETIEKNVKAATGADSRGIYDEARRPKGKKHLAVVNGSLRDRALLFEMDYLTNPEMGKKLQDPDYQKKLATGLANGIEEEAAKIRAQQKK